MVFFGDTQGFKTTKSISTRRAARSLSTRRAAALAEEAALAELAITWLKKPPVYPKAAAARSGDGDGGNGDTTDTEKSLRFPAADDDNKELDPKSFACDLL